VQKIVTEIVIEIMIEVGMEHTRLFQCNRFHCAENRQSPIRFFREATSTNQYYFSITIFCIVEHPFIIEHIRTETKKASFLANGEHLQAPLKRCASVIIFPRYMRQDLLVYSS